MNENTVELDVSKQPAVAPVLYIGQGDHNGTVLNVKMYDNGEPLDLTGMSVRFSMKAPNNLNYYTVNGTVDGNIATFTIDEEYAGGVPGKTEIAYVQVIDGDVTTSTNRMVVFVLPSADDNVEILPGYKNLIEQFLEESQAAVDEAVAAAEAIVDYQVPLMSATMRGGAKLGEGLEVGADEKLGIMPATTSAIGGVKPDGTTITADSDGTLHCANTYELPTMSPTTKGGAKLGSGLSVDGDALNLGPLTDSGSGASVQTDGCGIFGVTGEGWAEQDSTTGKNLCPNNATSQTINGVTFTVNADGSVTANGTNASSDNAVLVLSSNLTNFVVGQQYTLSGCPSGGSYSNYDLRISNGIEAKFDYGNGITLSLDNTDSIKFLIVVRPGVTISNLTFYPQLEAGSTATAYEPYTGGVPSPSPDYPQEIRVARGRNLLPSISPATVHGITATVGDDGEITLNGTATANANFMVPLDLPTGTYTLSANNDDIIGSGFSNFPYIFVSQSDNSWANQLVMNYANAKSTATSSNRLIRAVLVVPSGVTLSNFKLKPQLERGSDPTPYVPYGYIGLDITANGQTTTTPIPLPAKGFAGALPDGTADALEIDSAGRWEWVNATAITMQAVTDGVSGTVGTDVMSSTGVIADGATVLYEPSTPTTEHGYIQLPELLNGATVSIPELEAIGVEWWVDGAEAIAEHGRDVSKANKEQEDRIAELEAAVANLTTD